MKSKRFFVIVVAVVVVLGVFFFFFGFVKPRFQSAVRGGNRVEVAVVEGVVPRVERVRVPNMSVLVNGVSVVEDGVVDNDLVGVVV